MLTYPEFKKELRNVSHTYENESRNDETDIQKSEIENYSDDVAFKLEEEDMMSVHEEKKQHKSVPKEIKAFKCNICEYETPKNNLFKKHIKSIHKVIKPFKCTICEYETVEKGNLNNT